jgi:hypothetical protein
MAMRVVGVLLGAVLAGLAYRWISMLIALGIKADARKGVDQFLLYPPRPAARQQCGDGEVQPRAWEATAPRLAALRREMAREGLEAYVVPTTDAHQSEYVAPADRRLAWLSGFTGSSGLAVVTAAGAALWLDGRYYLQGEQQLGCEWEVMREEEPATAAWWEWLELQRLGPGAVASCGRARTGTPGRWWCRSCATLARAGRRRCWSWWWRWRRRGLRVWW